MLCRDDTSTPIGAYGSSVLIPALFGIGQCDAVPDPGFATQSITGACGQLVAVGGDIFEVKKGLSADCTVTANFVAAAAGSCGSANGVSTVAPPASNLCSTGTASAVAAGVGGANHTWSCLGTNPASTSDDAFCAAPSSLTAVNGTCNTNVDFGYVPPTTGLCNVGTATPVTTNPTNFTWGCNGANGGGSTAPNACNTLRKYTVLAVNGSPGGTVVCGNDSLFAAKPNTLTAVIGGTGPIICTATAEPGFSVQSISGCGGVATGPGVISYPFNATPANCTVTANYVGAAITAADAQPVPSNTSAALVLMLMSLLGIGAVALRKRNAV